MPTRIAPERLSQLLDQGSTLALIDVREHGEYNAAHIPGASSMPRRLLEFRLERLVPCRFVQVVLCDDDGQRAELAASTLEKMGYSRVSVLDGGVNRWSGLGLPIEWGMNVPSKKFGEQVEVEHRVPAIEATELDRRVKQGERVMILDTRTPEEYQQYCIPGGRSLPGGELAYRIPDLLEQQPDAAVVVNCAGRTRSIIGTRLLQRMGVRNVASLKNGTSGWVLAGLRLEQGAQRLELPQPSSRGRAEAEAFAARLAAEDRVRYVSIEELQGTMARSGQECVYLVDVRTEEEYAAGHIPGFWWFPGGQAVQRTDDLVAVKNASIVFCCDGRVRATVTASWYRQMGYQNVYVVDGGTTAWAARGLELERGPGHHPPFGLARALEQARRVAPRELRIALQSGAPPLILYVDTSRDFALGHVAGARWLSRSWLELRIESVAPDKRKAIVITDGDGRSAPLAATTLAELGYGNIAVLEGGMAAWRQADLPVEQGLSGVMTPPDDVVPSGPERSYAEMVNYLRWEEALARKS